MKKILGYEPKSQREAVLKMDWLEAGMLRGVLEKHDAYKDLPRSLQLKLDILFTQAYTRHDTLAKKAKADIRNMRKELRELTDAQEPDIIQKL